MIQDYDFLKYFSVLQLYSYIKPWRRILVFSASDIVGLYYFFIFKAFTLAMVWSIRRGKIFKRTQKILLGLGGFSFSASGKGLTLTLKIFQVFSSLMIFLIEFLWAEKMHLYSNWILIIHSIFPTNLLFISCFIFLKSIF